MVDASTLLGIGSSSGGSGCCGQLSPGTANANGALTAGQAIFFASGEGASDTQGTLTSYDVIGSVYTGQKADVNPPGEGEGISWNDDGTKVYIIDIGGGTIHELDLSTAYDISTFTAGNSFSNANIGDAGLVFNSTGTKFISGDDSSNLNEFSLSTPWDITTASFVQTVNLTQFAGGELGAFDVSPDGLKILAVSLSTLDTVYEYTLTSSFDVSTLSYSGNSLNVSSQTSIPQCISYNGDGSKFFVFDGNRIVYEYNSPTAFTLVGASYSGNSVSYNTLTGGDLADIGDVSISQDGLKLITGARNQFGESESFVFDVGSLDPASFLLGFALENATSGSDFSALMTTIGQITFAAAVKGDILTKSGNSITLNGSGTTIGVCLVDGTIDLLNVPLKVKTQRTSLIANTDTTVLSKTGRGKVGRLTFPLNVSGLDVNAVKVTVDNIEQTLSDLLDSKDTNDTDSHIVLEQEYNNSIQIQVNADLATDVVVYYYEE